MRPRATSGCPRRVIVDHVINVNHFTTNKKPGRFRDPVFLSDKCLSRYYFSAASV